MYSPQTSAYNVPERCSYANELVLSGVQTKYKACGQYGAIINESFIRGNNRERNANHFVFLNRFQQISLT
jgi:hypothetical protein